MTKRRYVYKTSELERAERQRLQPRGTEDAACVLIRMPTDMRDLLHCAAVERGLTLNTLCLVAFERIIAETKIGQHHETPSTDATHQGRPATAETPTPNHSASVRRGSRD